MRALKVWARQAAYKAGRFAEARRAADAWILIESTPEPHILLAEILDGMGHRGEARAVLAEVLRGANSPDSDAVARRLAVQLRRSLWRTRRKRRPRRSQVARRR